METANLVHREFMEVNHTNIDIYNANRETVYVNPLSKEQVPHSGSIILNEELVKNVSLIRLMYNIDAFSFLTRPFYIAGEKVNLSNYFSKNQYQSGILDIPVSFEVGKLGLKIPLNFSEFCSVTLFGMNTSVVSPCTLKKKEIYVLVSNESRYQKEVDLIELSKWQNKISDEKLSGIVVSNNNYNIEDGNFNLLRIWKKGEGGFMPIDYNGNRIDTYLYFTPDQFNGNIIDVPMDIKVDSDTKLMTTINPKSKVMFSLTHSENNNPKPFDINPLFN